MSKLFELWRRIHGFLNRRSIERELDDEMAFHRDMLARDLEQQGADGAEARAYARRRLGNPLQLREQSVAARGVPLLHDAGRDLRYTIRTLTRSPGFAVITILSLALGTAATTTMFSVVDAIDFRPLPFTNAKRLVVVYERAPAGHRMCSVKLGCMAGISLPAFADWQEQSRTLDAIGLFSFQSTRLRRGTETEPLATAGVTPDLFAALGSPARIGRTIAAGDANVIVLGHRVWENRFGKDPDIVGRRLDVIDENGRTESIVTVIGVMPPGFSVLSSEAWVPFSPEGSLLSPTEREARFALAIGHLAPGKTFADADREATLIAARLAAEYPQTNNGWSAGVVPFNGTTELRFNQQGAGGSNAGARRFALFDIVAFVLLIAVLNVAGLCLIRTVGRRRELTIRSAIGASSGRLARLVLMECLCIAVVGGVCGVGLSVWGIRWVNRALYLDATALPIGINLRALLFTLLTSTVAALIAGALPMIAAMRFDAAGALTSRLVGRGHGRSSTAQACIVAAEVACCLILLTGAGRLAKELLRYRYDEPGFDPRHLYLLNANFSRRPQQDSVEQRAIAAALIDRVRREPGVIGVSTAAARLRRASADPQSAPLSSIVDVAVSPNFFDVVGMRVLRGRGFDRATGDGPVAVVDSLSASLLWPGVDPIGKTFTYSDTVGASERVTVIGVVAPTKLSRSITRAPSPSIYRPDAQVPPRQKRFRGELYARVDGRPERVLPSLRKALHDITGAPVNVSDVTLMEAQLSEELRQQRFHTTLVSGFALFGLFLAALGLYGVTAYAAAARRREMAIRMALGAERRWVLGLVARRGLLIATAGVVVGLIGAIATERVLRSLLIEPTRVDFTVWVASALTLAICVLVASLLPARSAASDNLMTTLRSD